MKTRDSLGIYWTFDTSEGKYQDEVDGLIFYGYWKINFPQNMLDNLDSFQQIWKKFKIQKAPMIWDGSDNCNFSIAVRIQEWSEEHWNHCVEESLKWFAQFGASAAWCGTEYSSPSLDVFNLEKPSGDVYAAYSQETRFMCKSELYEEYKTLGEKELAKLRRVIA